MSLLAARYARLARQSSAQAPTAPAPVTDDKTPGKPQADPAADTLPFNTPLHSEAASPGRAGLVRAGCGQSFEHYCATCGAWGAFGFDVDLQKGRLGVWYCAKHRPGQATD